MQRALRLRGKTSPSELEVKQRINPSKIINNRRWLLSFETQLLMNAQSRIIAMISKSMAQIHSFGSHLDSKPGFMSKVRLSWFQLILIFTLIGIGSAASVGIRNEKQALEFNGFNLPLNLFSLRVGNNNTEFGGKQSPQ